MASNIQPKAIADQALTGLSKLLPNEFKAATSNKANLDKIKSAAEDAANEILQIIQNAEAKKAPEQCLSHLPADRVNRIKSALKFKTYEMAIAADLTVKFMMGGGGGVQIAGFPAMNIQQQQDADTAHDHQLASIILESYIFLLILLGLPLDEAAARKPENIKKFIDMIMKSRKLREIVAKMVNDYEAGNNWEVLGGMIDIGTTIYEEGFISETLKILIDISDMGSLDFLTYLARLIALVLSLPEIAAELLAKLISLIADAMDFYSKLKTLRQIEQRRGH